MKNIPSGNITFLFSDIEGNTRLSQDFPETIQASLDKHHLILQNAFESNNGFIFKIAGDAFCCAFENASDAVKTAVDAQLKLSEGFGSEEDYKHKLDLQRTMKAESMTNLKRI
ncbi:MAG: adenylate/guanylate cyclase domain-containing protein [Ignavibacteria bacterium]